MEIQVPVILLKLLKIRSEFIRIEILLGQSIQESIARIPKNGPRNFGEYIPDTRPGTTSMRSSEESDPKCCRTDGIIFLSQFRLYKSLTQLTYKPRLAPSRIRSNIHTSFTTIPPRLCAINKIGRSSQSSRCLSTHNLSSKFLACSRTPAEDD